MKRCTWEQLVKEYPRALLQPMSRYFNPYETAARIEVYLEASLVTGHRVIDQSDNIQVTFVVPPRSGAEIPSLLDDAIHKVQLDCGRRVCRQGLGVMLQRVDPPEDYARDVRLLSEPWNNAGTFDDTYAGNRPRLSE